MSIKSITIFAITIVLSGSVLLDAKAETAANTVIIFPKSFTDYLACIENASIKRAMCSANCSRPVLSIGCLKLCAAGYEYDIKKCTDALKAASTTEEF